MTTTTEVYITANLPGAPIKGFDEPDTMVITIPGWTLTCSATVEEAEKMIAHAMKSWGLDIRAEVMGALSEHLAPASAQCSGQATASNSPLAA